MKLELFNVPGCGKCAGAVGPLRAVAQSVAPESSWREVNVLDELEHAVELGILTLPALAIDNELVFAALPTPEALKAELLRRKGSLR